MMKTWTTKTTKTTMIFNQKHPIKGCFFSTLDKSAKKEYNQRMKRTKKTFLLCMMLAVACMSGCTWNFKQAFCNHQYTEITVAPSCMGEGYTAERCEECAHETNKRNIKPMWGAHSGFGVCTGCRQEIWKMLAADLEQEGVNYVDAYGWYQGINANEWVSLYKQKSTGKVFLAYKGAYSTIEIDLTDTNCQFSYVLDNSVFSGILSAQEIPQDENARDRAQKYAMVAASAAEKYFLQGKKYSMKNFAFVFV